MPQVPIYDAPQVAPQNVPGFREQTPYRLTQSVSTGALEQQKAGRALSEAGKDVVQAATAEQIQQNEAAGKEYDANLMGAIQGVLYGTPGDPTSGYLNQKGKNAIDGYQDAAQALQQLPQKLSSSLSNPAQQQLVGPAAQMRVQAALTQAAQHAAQQNTVYQQTASQTRVKIAQDGAALSFNGMQDKPSLNFDQENPGANSPYQQYLQTVKSEATDQAGRMGLEGDVAGAYVQDQLRNAYIGTLSHLIGGNGKDATPGQIKQAQAYYADVKDKLTAEQRDKIEPILNAGAAKDQALSLFLSGTSIAKANEMFKNGEISAEVHDMLQQRVEHAVAQGRAAAAEGDRATIGQIWDFARQGKSLADLPPTVLARIKQRGLGEHVDAIFDRAMGRGGNDAQLYVDQMRMASEDPNGFSQQNLAVLSGQLSQSHWEHLVNIQAGINKQDAKVMEVNKVQQSAVRDAMASIRAAGINPSPKPGSSDADTWANFEASLHDALFAAIQQNNGQLTRDDARTITQGLLRDQALSGSGYFGTSFGETHMPVYKMTPEQRAAPWSVPDTDRAQIVQSLQRKGMPVTESNIQRVYKASQGIR